MLKQRLICKVCVTLKSLFKLIEKFRLKIDAMH